MGLRGSMLPVIAGFGAMGRESLGHWVNTQSTQ
jgi:hypothetical protein